jgi:hypothetical protein
MTYYELKNIGITNLLTDASLRNLNVERECFLAKWALSMSWHIATTENMGEELVTALDNARIAWAINGIVPGWSNLLDLLG